MAEEQMWTIEFYRREDGTSPVTEFLETLDKETRARFDWSIEQLRVRNIQASEPLVRHLEGTIWELRRESSTNIYRLFYSLLSGRRILFVHGFAKKTQKLPTRELEVARRRLARFEEREGGEE